MNVRKRSRPFRRWAPGILLAILAACQFETTVGHEEKYVSVRLNDSLSRYDSVQVLILAEGDTSKVIGTLWNGHLDAPGGIPAYRLDDAESRPLSIRVKGYDATGRLTLDMLITKQDGKQVVTDRIVPKPSPNLASLQISPGSLTPAFDPAVKEYAVSLAHNQTWLQATLTPVYPQAKMWADANRVRAGEPAEPIDMRVGQNRIALNITAADTSAQYVLNVNRAAATNPDTTRVPPDTIKGKPFAAWKHMAMVTADFGQVNMPGTAVVADFPVLLRLTKANFKMAEAAADGRDLRFATQDDAGLPYEITLWDPERGEARIWVKVDAMRASNPIPFNIYWGNASASSQSDGSKVFPESAGWSGIWHLEEAGRGASGEYKDAMGRNPGTAGSKTLPSRKDGQVSFAQDFKTTNDQTHIRLPDGFDPGPEAWTFQVWVKPEGSERGALFTKGSGTDPKQQRFQILSMENTGKIALYRSNGSYATEVALSQGAWNLLGITYDGSKARIFLNGAERESVPWTQGGNALAPVWLGAVDDNGGTGFQGMLDEMWFSRTARSADYMRLAFESQKAYSPLLTVLPLY